MPRHEPETGTGTGAVRQEPRNGTAETTGDTRSAVPPTGPAAGPPAAVVPTDRVRWGPVWAGTLVALATFLVMNFLLFALGWMDVGFEGGTSTVARGAVSAILGIVAFFIGGMLAGASAGAGEMTDGIVNGVLVWALGVVGLIALALAGGTSLLGPLAEASGQLQLPDAVPDAEAALTTARHTAGWAALGLGVYVTAAALGGAVGAGTSRRHRTTTGR